MTPTTRAVVALAMSIIASLLKCRNRLGSGDQDENGKRDGEQSDPGFGIEGHEQGGANSK